MAQQWNYDDKKGWTQESYLDKASRVWITGEDSILNRSARWLQTQQEKPKSRFEQTLIDASNRFYEASMIGPAEDHAIEQTTKGMTNLSRRLGASDLQSQLAGASAGFLVGMIIPGPGEAKGLVNLNKLRKAVVKSESQIAKAMKKGKKLSSEISPEGLLKRQGLDAPGFKLNKKELNAKILELRKKGHELPAIKEKLLGKETHWINPEGGERISLQRNTKEPFKTRFIGMFSRDRRDVLRKTTEVIPLEEVEKLAKKYNQPDDVVRSFLQDQITRKKQIDDTIRKINARIKKNPDAYSKDFKASLGHGRAAYRYLHSANIVSNLDIEDFLTNVGRSNKDEISDMFNRALGRSLDLEEEFLKFIDNDLGSFHKGLKLGRWQKDKIIEYVRKNMTKDIDWKSDLNDMGEQAYKSKEQFLIDEAIEKFGGKRLKP